MGSFPGTSEIVEYNEELDSIHLSLGSKKLNVKLKPDGKSSKHLVEDDLDRLIRAIDIRTSSRVLGSTSQASADLLRRNTLKKPVRVEGAGIGISESVTLKQALRKVCISQASEMAAMKRLSKSVGLSGVSEAGTIKRLYASVVVQSSDPDVPLGGVKNDLVQISIMPEGILTESSPKATKCSEIHNLTSLNQMSVSSRQKAASNKSKAPKVTIKDVIKPMSAGNVDGSSAALEKEEKAISKAAISGSQRTAASSKSIVAPRLVKPVIRNKAGIKKKVKRELALPSGSSKKGSEVNNTVAVLNTNKSSCTKESVSPSSKSLNPVDESGIGNIHISASNTTSSPSSCNVGRGVGNKTNECSRFREKGESSQSSKSSIGDYSSSTSISHESHQSGGSSNGSRPHMSKDARWVAIRQIAIQQGGLGLKNFKLLKRLGCGDIGTVYLAELVDTECLFALKVMDIEFLISRKKMMRAQTEREILQMLDHPFLPTLFAHFTTDNLLCLVMEFCPGGDLHVLRQKQPGRCFSEPAARFYVSEVLLALEYLHMLGVIYRDLKPENILVRDDGHIMLSDFDLSLRCSVSPTLLRSSSLGTQENSKRPSGPCPENSCIDPLCLQPSWVQVSCFTPRLVSSTAAKSRKVKADSSGQVSPLPQLVVEPTDARSNSFVGTHEYLAPEIIRGDGHGSAVDWWTFGIFLYELLYGRTPFKGPGNDETLANVVSQSLKFPENSAVSFNARDLIRGLLVKEPENRLGFMKGAAEIKQHPFFEGLNWALIRCAPPPETPSYEVGTPVVIRKKKEGKCLDFRTNGEDVEFELF